MKKKICVIALALSMTACGVIYLCTRDTVNPVYNTLASLVGLYVEAV